jgi:phosphotransferase system enzyme I (PtsI)
VRTLTGVGCTPLAGVGTARWYRPGAALTLPERPDPSQVERREEHKRFETARDEARAAIERAGERAADRVGQDEAAVFDAHREFLDDPQLVDDIEAAIESGTPAEHAVADRFEEAITRFEGMEGRMAERADDLRDVRDRLLRALLDVDTVDPGTLPEGTVLLAERLRPSDTARLDPEAVAGIATTTGGRTAHTAIMARALSIPAVVGLGDRLDSVSGGTDVLVDGTAGELVTNPTESRRAAASDLTAPVRSERVTTVDGREIPVAANVGTPTAIDAASDRGADGIGLFRTELLFLDRAAPPDEDEQYEAVTTALERFPDDRVVVRTLDVGGDKSVPYLNLPAETNPFLGRRGVRLSLDDHAELFETQLRALLRAAGSDHGDGLAVMLPMVSRVSEVESARDHIETVAADLAAEGVEHAVPELGAMVETPAAAALAGALARRLDFLSIGTNDLTQYVMAADRESDAVADLHDPRHPAVLRTIEQTVTAAHDAGAWVGMCGEMAGDPALTELLVGLGLDELSASATTIPAIKNRLRNTETKTAQRLAEEVLACDTRAAVREMLAGADD